MGGEKQQLVNGEVSSDHGSAATADSGRGPSEDGAVPATDDGISLTRLIRTNCVGADSVVHWGGAGAAIGNILCGTWVVLSTHRNLPPFCDFLH